MFKFLGPLLQFLSKLLDFSSDVKRDRKEEELKDKKQQEEKEIREDPAEWFNKNFSSKHQKDNEDKKNGND